MKLGEGLRRLTPGRCAEWFVAANIAFLGVDIALAHTENAFRRPAEWAPLGFSALATLLLVPMIIGRSGRLWRAIECGVAAAAILVGVAGMVFHLQSGFFLQQTLHDLVYSAPFMAPLAYVGVGLLLLLLRMEPAGSPIVAWWLVLLALGGFVGNLGLSLLDHAQNGFFHWTEWIPVIAAAFASSFLFMVLIRPTAPLLSVTWPVLALEVIVGLVGFVLHAVSDLRRPAVAAASAGLPAGLPAGLS